MTQAPPPESPRTPGYGEGNQGYGPSAGQPGSGYGAPAGQPGGYGAPGDPYGAPGDPYGAPVRREDTVGVVGIVLTLIGAAAVLVSYLAVKWFSASIHNVDFGDLHDEATGGSGNTEVFKLYFSWLGWALLAATVVVALVANLPTPASPGLRVFGLLLGLAGVALTFWAIRVPHVGYSDILKEARVGFYLAAGGFLVAGIGAVVGPQRR